MTNEQIATLAELYAEPLIKDGLTPAGEPTWIFSASGLRALIDGACPEKDLCPVSGFPMTDATYNAVHKVYLRAGMLVMRELLNQADDVTIEDFWPAELCPDPGKPRQLRFSEICDGGENGPWTAKDHPPEIEALPIAHGLIEAVRHERLPK